MADDLPDFDSISDDQNHKTVAHSGLTKYC
jgi:hypothetical protein